MVFEVPCDTSFVPFTFLTTFLLCNAKLANSNLRLTAGVYGVLPAVLVLGYGVLGFR